MGYDLLFGLSGGQWGLLYHYRTTLAWERTVDRKPVAELQHGICKPAQSQLIQI